MELIFILKPAAQVLGNKLKLTQIGVLRTIIQSISQAKYWSQSNLCCLTFREVDRCVSNYCCRIRGISSFYNQLFEFNIKLSYQNYQNYFSTNLTRSNEQLTMNYMYFKPYLQRLEQFSFIMLTCCLFQTFSVLGWKQFKQQFGETKPGNMAIYEALFHMYYMQIVSQGLII
ncbi:Hypothetical_protein [Hexamita inflata]|uniref:Hypothetical_protein n=1 Tax=Hexamita inflata TaxID=28002 RepID=A0AA86QP42_9EUKA|nr:Hypothetical protein HINF_LOCUS49745 [Hexamita inflata]